MRFKSWVRSGAVASCLAVLAACGSLSDMGEDGGLRDIGLTGASGNVETGGRLGVRDKRQIGLPAPMTSAVEDLSDGAVRPGSRSGSRVPIERSGRKVQLNYKDADLREFLRSVFESGIPGALVIDPSLNGRVTIQTTDPVDLESLPEIVREVLKGHSATLSRNENVWRVSIARPGDPMAARNSENTRIIPLTYAEPEDMKAALQAFANTGVAVQSNGKGRFLIVSGSTDLDALEQLVRSLDVDEMKGISFVLKPLRQASAANVAAELGTMFGSDRNPSLRIIPIHRMNAIIVAARHPDQVKRAAKWIETLDRERAEARRVFIHPVQNRRATDLARILKSILKLSPGSGGSETGQAEGTTRPTGQGQTAHTPTRAGAGSADAAASTETSAESGEQGSRGSILQGPASVDADLSTNSLVIVASAQDYRLIESTIQRLDVVPSQVLIEVTIAEVELSDTLRNGVRWFFEHGNHSLKLASDGGAVSPNYPGFNYVFDAARARAVIDVLSAVTKVEVISSPALTVLDNQTATLKVGDQVPIAVRSSQSVSSSDAPVVNDIQLKDTGIILSVTPRVSASGTVQLDISQEASNVVATTTSGIDSPTIRQRSVVSTVSVPNGNELVLGGLISKNKNFSKSGVPYLKDLPGFGAAFTFSEKNEYKKTELIIIMRPLILTTKSEIRAVTDEIKRRVKGFGAEGGRP